MCKTDSKYVVDNIFPHNMLLTILLHFQPGLSTTTLIARKTAFFISK